MSPRVALLVLGVLAAVTASVGVGVAQVLDHREERSRTPTVSVAEEPASGGGFGEGPRIVFRHTGIDQQYGHLASVPLADPGGARSFADRECDRVDVTTAVMSCLVTERGLPTRFASLVLDPDGGQEARSELDGIPSRTRLSPSGRLVATTVFVSGHSYQQTGFSTSTVVRGTDGSEPVDLEDLELVLEGRVVQPVDRNYWGVTFRDDRVFWATVATGGRTYLVRGDLSAGRLTSVVENAECPSLSPDGTRIAYKVRVGGSASPVWEVAVRDLGTGDTVRLPATRGLDDQVEWLDDRTLLYGLPRDDEPGVTDVWAIDATHTTGRPELLVEQAWSPSVVP